MSWTNKPSAFTKTIEADLTKKQKDIVIDALGGVVMQSPVDEGSYRASHRVSINQPDIGFNEAEKDKGGGSTISKGTSVLSRLVPYSTVYIQTNAPYANKIEFGGFTTKAETEKTTGGYSKQAPQGVYSTTFNYIAQKYGG
ncbi:MULTISPECIES: hypothetical protein [Acinetobacter]|uniref:hypothetical protein n=1 Tax=Acinetobacter TaxID=469 RepID=UPI000C60146E|nr:MULTISPECIES: hypothetical protein [unclassified Acinetobacter]MBC70433.1 hypothetical protein [Acinetobacter sp.]MBT51721.1 hypothetical protein [Acinetobacter sp.]|tara:strand:+ start:899 stop:1321 length:423 start_codon:yes stop_codon:yes gene_type:complete